MVDIKKLEAIVGTDNVACDPETLQKYAGDISFVNPTRPACVVRPSAADAVRKIIQLANENQTPLVPISSGAPHFKGDTVPGAGGAVIVDLSRMNNITFVDRPRRNAMIEPGVTFGDLIPEVKKEGIRLNMPLLPRNTKSVIGSILEREPVIMPGYQWDISDPLACAGLFFGNGEEFRTGQAAGPGSIEGQWKAGGRQKAPYGPGTASLHRLIQGAQGSIGIITWMSIRCELAPCLEEPFMVASGDINELLELTAWLVRLRMVSECFILNNTNIASIFSKTEAEFQAIKDRLPPYVLFYTLPGYDYFPEERISSNVADIAAMNQRIGLSSEKAIGSISADEMLSAFQRPSDEPYWKIRHRGAVEDIFFLTIHDKIEGQISAMQEMANTAGYNASDLGIYVQSTVQGTSYHCEFNLFYDPENPMGAERVKDLSCTAVKHLMNKGAFFSRPYGNVIGDVLNRDSATLEVVTRLKDIFDPNNILNPGKIF